MQPLPDWCPPVDVLFQLFYCHIKSKKQYYDIVRGLRLNCPHNITQMSTEELNALRDEDNLAGCFIPRSGVDEILNLWSLTIEDDIAGGASKLNYELGSLALIIVKHLCSYV
jgi:hypothetical protein